MTDGADWEALRRGATLATEPTDAEVAGLLRRLEAPDRKAVLPARTLRSVVASPRFALLGVALVALALLLRPAAPDYGPAPAPGSRLLLAWGQRALGPSITLRGDARLEVAAAGPYGTRLRLLAGTVRAKVDPEGPFRALTVEAPGGVSVSVLGTVFSVAWDEDAGTGEVRVERGQVAVVDPRGDVALSAGEVHRWARSDGGVVRDDSPPDEAAQSGLPSAGVGVAAGASAPATQRPITTSPVASSPLTTSSDADPTGHSSEPLAALPAPVGPPSAPLDLEAARVFSYLQAAMETGRTKAAARLAADFMRDHADGPLSREAGALQIEALATEDPAAAVAAAAVWLERNPGHARALDVLRIRATLGRDHFNDCALAAPDYAILAALVTGEEQARAEAIAGLCFVELGDHAAARRHLDRALTHPDLSRVLLPRVRAARRELPSEASP